MVYLSLLMLFACSCDASIIKLSTTSSYKPIINCYHGLWHYNYRSSKSFFKHLKLDTFNNSYCTHLSFAYIEVAEIKSILKRKPKTDNIDRYKLQHPQLKLIAVIGGPRDNSARLSEIAADPKGRGVFIKLVIQLTKYLGFHGVELHWRRLGPLPRDRMNFVTLTREMYESMMDFNFTFGISVRGDVKYARLWYDAPNLKANADYINVLAYNYSNTNVDLYHAPLYESGGHNIAASMAYWLGNGTPPQTLLLGIAFIGRSLIMKSDDNVPYRRGHWSKRRVKAYHEICLDEKLIGSRYAEEVGATFLINNNTWTGYESRQSIDIKMQFVYKASLRGVGIWTIENDDVFGICDESYPLLRMVHKKFNDDERWIVEE
uniref:GH18 domain-containing protein n=1 Tax=Stomoxys calcitrans TaxID=35570 RepID=A0A1I8PMY4_STOCA